MLAQEVLIVWPETTECLLTLLTHLPGWLPGKATGRVFTVPDYEFPPAAPGSAATRLHTNPDEYVLLRPWAGWPLTTFEPVGRELGDNEVGKRLILEPGEHGIVVGTGKGVWLCGALAVTDS
jgi:hypothetical protein